MTLGRGLFERRRSHFAIRFDVDGTRFTLLSLDLARRRPSSHRTHVRARFASSMSARLYNPSGEAEAEGEPTLRGNNF
jgi:hypothetical protein